MKLLCKLCGIRDRDMGSGYCKLCEDTWHDIAAKLDATQAVADYTHDVYCECVECHAKRI